MQVDTKILRMHEAMSEPPEPAAPIVTLMLASAKELLKLLDDGRPETLDNRRAVNELRAAIDQEQPELWGIWSVGPSEFHPSISKEGAEQDRQATLAALAQVGRVRGEQWPEVAIEVVRSPLSPDEHWQEIALYQRGRADGWQARADGWQARADGWQARADGLQAELDALKTRGDA